MKTRMIIATVLCLLLTACAGIPTETTITPPPATPPSTPAATQPTEPTTVPTEPTTVPTTTPLPVTFQVYYPDGDWINFLSHEVTLTDVTPEAVLAELITVGIVNQDVAVNSIAVDGTQLLLDLNGAFYSQLCTLGTTGERFVIGSIVNTFLSAYSAETIMITADGAFMDSGHVVYDFPLSFIE